MTQANESPLTFEDTHFRYDRQTILDGFTFNANPGEVVLLAAPNGAGKTTALWLAAGLLEPDSGHVSVFGRSPFHHREILGRIGFLAEGAPLPQSWTNRQVLEFQRGTFPRWDQAENDRLVEKLGLDLKKRVKNLSKGERGKLALATVLSVRPDLLLLDEPTLGLDVATRRMLASELLSQLAERGCTVLIASHEIADAERTADRFVFIDQGKVACDEPVSELLERHRILAWEGSHAAPPKELDLLMLPERLGQRALARQWRDPVAASWLSSGGQVSAADLETIYLSLSGELSHA